MPNRGDVKLYRGEVMAYWVSGRREWRNFCFWKQQYRKAAGVAGILYKVIKFTRIGALIESALVKTNDIIITSTGVSVNGKFKSFAGESRTLQHIQIIDETNPKILQICYRQLTAGRVSCNNIYVPIPKGRLGEAVRVMSQLESA